MIFPENIGTHLSIDETCLSYDQLYTIVTNKSAKGRKIAIVAIIKDIAGETIIKHLQKISFSKRKKVLEITLDMASNMELITKRSFPRASLDTDRFHVQKTSY